MTKYDCAQSGGQGDNPLFKCLSPTPPWLKKKCGFAFLGISTQKIEWNTVSKCLALAQHCPALGSIR